MGKNIINIEYDNETQEIKILGFTESNGDTYIVEGDCIRCGQCCVSRCNHLIVDNIDGENIYSCVIHELRPALCVIFPCNVQDIIDNPKCTYKLKLVNK
jgi:hypothetical protein